MTHAQLKLFSLNSNQPLAQAIAQHLEVPLGQCQVRRFSDGEVQINIEESVRGQDVFIIQSTNAPVNTHLMELLIMIDALRRASAKTINVVMPYFGYARQDRKARSREPITAKLVANLLQEAGVTRLLTLDLHASQLQGFFDIPVDNLFTLPLFTTFYANEEGNNEELVVVAPKNSGVQRARALAENLNTTLAIVDQMQADDQKESYVIGDVKGKTCVLIDDILNTGATLAAAANVLKQDGASAVYACVSHGLFSETAKACLEAAPIEEICVTDSVQVATAQIPQTVRYISSAELIAKAIRFIYEEKPVSPLFKVQK